MTASSAERLLLELGVVRYRLRARPESMPVPPSTPTPSVPVAGKGQEQALVRLSVAEPSPWPADAQAVWAEVLAWLGLRPEQVAWSCRDGDGPLPIAVPDPARWPSAHGRRALWQALKGVVGSLRGDPSRPAAT